MPDKKTINVNVAATTKSQQATAALTTSTKSTSGSKASKKIDMGAATNFGKTDLGINSPTHRNTHAEEDLFAANDNNIINNNVNSKNELFEDMFRTCPTTPASSALSSSATKTISNQNDDDDFNPRGDETQEFGDFESAFGGAQQQQKQSITASTILSNISTTNHSNEEFDFEKAFSQQQSSQLNSSSSNNLMLGSGQQKLPMQQSSLLFGQSTQNNAGLMGNMLSNVQQQQSTTASNDLLSDFGELNLSSPISNGKLLLLYFLVKITVDSLAKIDKFKRLTCRCLGSF